MIERLEQRRLLTGFDNVQSDGLGTLYLTGTPYADYYEISMRVDGAVDAYDGGDWLHFYPPPGGPAYGRVVVDCGDGADIVHAYALSGPDYEWQTSVGVNGDAGDDTLYGDGGHVDLYGGYGDDWLEISGEGDQAQTLSGGPGNDWIVGSGHSVDSVFSGGDGNDTIGVGGLDNGSGQLFGGYGDDTIYGSHFQDTYVNGGPGYDVWGENGNSDGETTHPSNVLGCEEFWT